MMRAGFLEGNWLCSHWLQFAVHVRTAFEYWVYLNRRFRSFYIWVWFDLARTVAVGNLRLCNNGIGYLVHSAHVHTLYIQTRRVRAHFDLFQIWVYRVSLINVYTHTIKLLMVLLSASDAFGLSSDKVYE